MNDIRETINRIEQINNPSAVREDDGMISKDEYEEAIHGLQQAQHMIAEGASMLHDVLKSYAPLQGDLRYWESYGLAQLNILTGGGMYASNDANIQDLIEKLEEELAGYPEEGAPGMESITDSVRPTEVTAKHMPARRVRP